jgi:DNA-damage-inducible protein J
MATLQIRMDDNLKASADSLFAGLGLDTPTAVRIFLSAAIEHNGLPFAVGHKDRKPNAELMEALKDVKLGRNLIGPFDTVDAAMKALLED